MLLQLKGHVPRVAYNASDALALAREAVPHLMLIDLSMPDVDGYTLLHELRAIDTPGRMICVALSGHASFDLRARRARASTITS